MVPARWVPRKLFPGLSIPGAKRHQLGSLTCLLPGSPASSGPFSRCLCRPCVCLFLWWPVVTTLFLQPSSPLVSLYPRVVSVTQPFLSLPSQDKHGGGGKNKELEGRPRGKPEAKFQNGQTHSAPQFRRQPGPSLAALPALGFGGEGDRAFPLLLVFVHVKN